jgi:hypothetical protein
MSQNEEKKQTYEVWIVRQDGNHIRTQLTNEYDKCFEDWKKLVDLWKSCVADKTPFSITTPVVTAFDPGLIMEITIRPVVKIAESKYDNPYQQKMLDKGLLNTLNNKGNVIDPNILDEGYR